MKLSFESGKCQCASRAWHAGPSGHSSHPLISAATMVLRTRGGGETVPPTIFAQECEERPMDFNMSDRQREWLNRVESFMHKHVRPAVPVYKQQDAEGERWKVIPVMEDLKKKVRADCLWTMFMQHSSH